MILELEVRCDDCGATLEASLDFNYSSVAILVEPCKDCLDTVRDDAHNDGYSEGYDAGVEESE